MYLTTITSDSNKAPSKFVLESERSTIEEILFEAELPSSGIKKIDADTWVLPPNIFKVVYKIYRVNLKELNVLPKEALSELEDIINSSI